MGRIRRLSKSQKYVASLALVLWLVAGIGYSLKGKKSLVREAQADASITIPKPPREPTTEDRYVERYGEVFRASCENAGDCLALREVHRRFCGLDDLSFLQFTGECVRGRCVKIQFPCQHSEKCRPNIGCR